MVGSISRITLSDGSTRYRARYRDPGGRQHERRFARKVDAQRWLDEATSALVTQTWTAPERGRITVADWADRWLSSQTGVKPSTLYRYGNLLRTHVLPSWGRHRLADVTPHDLRHTAASLAVASGATVKSVQRMLGHASAAMTLDVYSGLFDDDLTALADRMDAAALPQRPSHMLPAARSAARCPPINAGRFRAPRRGPPRSPGADWASKPPALSGPWSRPPLAG